MCGNSRRREIGASKALRGWAAPGESLTRGLSDKRAPVTSREGREALAVEPWAADLRARTARDVIGFLLHGRGLHSPAGIAVTQGISAEPEGQARAVGRVGNVGAQACCALVGFRIRKGRSKTAPLRSRREAGRAVESGRLPD